MAEFIKRGRGAQVMYMGKAGEHAVASQLFLRGTTVLWPGIDVGYDLMTETGCRVQIKTSYIDGHTRRGESYYWFPLSTSRIQARKGVATRIAIPDMAKRCDVVAFWGIDQNRFWIVPVGMLRGTQGISLGAVDPQRFSGSMSDIRAMVELGYSRYAIAKQYDISVTSLRLLIESGRDNIPVTTTSQVRACENAWHHIIDFNTPALQAPVNIPEISSQDLEA
jgi:hypothetical protein